MLSRCVVEIGCQDYTYIPSLFPPLGRRKDVHFTPVSCHIDNHSCHRVIEKKMTRHSNVFLILCPQRELISSLLTHHCVVYSMPVVLCFYSIRCVILYYWFFFLITWFKWIAVHPRLLFLSSYVSFFFLSRFKTLLANRPCGENTCIEISNVKYHIFQVKMSVVSV